MQWTEPDSCGSSAGAVPARPLIGITLSRRSDSGETMNTKQKIILDRIEFLKDAIRKANEYLESGEHADWKAFRPLFDRKLRDGEELAPHKDWVKHVFLPRREKALSRQEKLLQSLSLDTKSARSAMRRRERRRPAG
jgi:hypothetical protein